MVGHQDDLELTFDKPVVSISLGLPAVFVLGGTSKNDSAVPILVRAGDVMMLHDQTRLSYHGVARIMVNETLPPISAKLDTVCKGTRLLKTSCVDDQTTTEIFNEEYKKLQSLFKEYRININLRQVLPDGYDSIDVLHQKRQDVAKHTKPPVS